MSAQALEIAFRADLPSPLHRMFMLALADGVSLAIAAQRCGIEESRARAIARSLHDSGHITLSPAGVWFRDRAGWISAGGACFP